MIELPEDNPAHIALMLDFLYYQGYDLGGFLSNSHNQHPNEMPRFHVSLFALGDKYAIPALRAYAEGRFCEHFDRNALQSGAMTEILQCVPSIYEMIGGQAFTIRTYVVQQVSRHSKELLKDENKKVMLVLMDSIRGFREDVCLALLAATAALTDALGSMMRERQ